MNVLTKKQKQVFDFIGGYISDNGISPSMDEIRRKMRLKAVSTVHEHINTLRYKGYLSQSKNLARSIYPKQLAARVINIPILGKIAAGFPIEAIEMPGTVVSIANNTIKDPRGYYALRVEGDSMVDEGIFDGDIVVIKKQSVADNGQTVIAIIDDNKATLKKIYREKNIFRLEPRNQMLLPLFRKDVEIRGVVSQIIRNLDKSIPQNNGLEIQKSLRTIDLFAGVGGIRKGFENAGFKTVFANDFEAQCKETYDLNYKDTKLVVEDIRRIDIDDLPEFDFLLAGFPCQAFSIAGYRQGFKDEKDRGNLFFDIVRILKARKPEGFLLENVKNLKNHDNGKTFRVIEKALIDLGYHIKAKVLNSMEYGNIPQNRERIYIVGFKNIGYAAKFLFPAPIKLSISVADLLEKNVPDKYYYNGKPLFNKLKNVVKDEGKVYQWRRQYVRENKKDVCPTLTANMGTGGHNVPIIKDKNGIRKLIPIECARIQGFPSDYKLPNIADSALYKQFGNSVSVPVVERIALSIKEAMG